MKRNKIDIEIAGRKDVAEDYYDLLEDSEKDGTFQKVVKDVLWDLSEELEEALRTELYFDGTELCGYFSDDKMTSFQFTARSNEGNEFDIILSFPSKEHLEYLNQPCSLDDLDY